MSDRHQGLWDVCVCVREREMCVTNSIIYMSQDSWHMMCVTNSIIYKSYLYDSWHMSDRQSTTGVVGFVTYNWQTSDVCHELYHLHVVWFVTHVWITTYNWSCRFVPHNWQYMIKFVNHISHVDVVTHIHVDDRVRDTHLTDLRFRAAMTFRGTACDM